MSEQKFSDLFDNIEKLSKLIGVSGGEEDVREFIISRLPSECEYKTDNIGNLLVFKKGRKTPKNKVMLCAHTDEVGFIVSSLSDNGTLKFSPVGGINPSVVFGRKVIFKNGVIGVIAAKAVHMLSDEEEEKQPKLSDLSIDIGAKDKEEALKYIAPGDFCTFMSDYEEFGEGFIKGKALDDRTGCAILLELLSRDNEYDMYCAFTVQEEIGTRGAACAAYNVKPDMAIVLETTTACDISGVEDEKKVCILGNGAVASFMDKGTIYDRELYRLSFECAEKAGVKCQTKTLVAGGNDSGAIHKAVGGIRTAALSVPTRYLHSPSCVMKKEDVIAVLETAAVLSERLSEL